jgi:hypothetical protein
MSARKIPVSVGLSLPYIFASLFVADRLLAADALGFRKLEAILAGALAAMSAPISQPDVLWIRTDTARPRYLRF